MVVRTCMSTAETRWSIVQVDSRGFTNSLKHTCIETEAHMRHELLAGIATTVNGQAHRRMPR